MAIKRIYTGILAEEIVETLPQVGTENKVYRRLVDDEILRESQITEDFIWHNGAWHEFSYSATMFGACFDIFQQSVIDTVNDLEARVAALENKGVVIIDQSVSNMQSSTVDFIEGSPYIDEGDTVIVEIEGLTYDGIASPTDINQTVEVGTSAFRVSNKLAIVQFDEWAENQYFYLNVYNGETGRVVQNPSCENLKVTLIKEN